MSLFENEILRLRGSEKVSMGRYCEARKIRYYGFGQYERTLCVKEAKSSNREVEWVQNSLEYEANYLSRIHHPSIVAPVDFMRTKEGNVIIMEYVEGSDLKRLLGQLPNFPPVIVLSLGIQILRALKVIHNFYGELSSDIRFIHRDLSLGNIMVQPCGHIKIVDFGSATSNLFPSSLPQEIFRGREGYLAPEVLSGRGMDARMDLFALGVILYRFATGKMPFQGAHDAETREQVLHLEPRAPSKWNRQMNRLEDRAIMKCLEKDPHSRFQTADEALQAFEKSFIKRKAHFPIKLCSQFFFSQP